MEGLFNSFARSGSWHHAYIIVGEPQPLVIEVEKFLRRLTAEGGGGRTEVYASHFGSFGIEESRQLKEWQQLRPRQGDKQYYVVGLDFITREAQNALLKTLEEPAPHNHFFIIVQAEDVLLPTIRSRCEIIHTPPRPLDPRMEHLVRQFLSSSGPARIAFVAEFLPEEEGKQKVLQFLNTLEVIIGREAVPAIRARVLPEIVAMRRYLYDRAPALRLILEHLSFAVPQV